MGRYGLSASSPGPSRLRVTVDASQLSGQSAHSGIGSYVRGLLGGLAALPAIRVEAMATGDVLLPEGIARRQVTRRFRTGRPAIIEHETRRSLELARGRPEVFHNPNPHAPLAPPRPWVQTLHDTIPLHSSDQVDAAFRRRFERFGRRYLRADAVIAVSRHAADEGMTMLGIPATHIEVIHHGVAPEFTPGPGPDGPPYLLVVCEYSRRKNIECALACLDAVVDAGFPHRLRLVGQVPPWLAADHAALIARARHPDRVDVVGFVDDVVREYRGASVTLVPSRHEGFGLPALEAMACASPVVCFANTSLTEVVGDGGELVADGDVPGFGAAVLRLLGDPAVRADAAARARHRAGAFDWQRAAAATAEVYRRVSR